ncbi:Rho termination factor N-terminal domain-containing protein [Clostridium sp.]|uniref:Rho termination factor N-terminal domain-containing protein n=1 Tax=Clostridium sp. TaxID=1506 RepID=UPI001A45940E|nr:Rho termination factor N-terminal domain-containing protein [Clostridium sp.]MBK5242053.1 Rho termination factor N-terminal domain-containing protein [Clostridium sp.]
MAKIYSKNKKYNGISAGVNFVNGVGETDVPHLISWFHENGYTIVKDKNEPINYENMNYKELVEIAKEKGLKGTGMKKVEIINKINGMEE